MLLTITRDSELAGRAMRVFLALELAVVACSLVFGAAESALLSGWVPADGWLWGLLGLWLVLLVLTTIALVATVVEWWPA